MQCLQLLPRDIQMIASLLCIKSRNCWDQAPEPRCLGTTLRSKCWHSWAHLTFPFFPWCQLQCVFGPVLGYFSTGSWQSLHCFLLLGLFSHTLQVHPLILFCVPPQNTPFLLCLQKQAVCQLRPLPTPSPVSPHCW